jgi:hypothetical protein
MSIEYSEVFKKTRFKQPQGAVGLFFTLPGFKNVTVVDRKGRGLRNVVLKAKNAADDFPSVTDDQGGAFMLIDDNTIVEVTKDSVSKEVLFTNGETLLIEIDIPIIPY